jgi:hypothetical protein
MEFTPASKSGKRRQSSEYQSAAVVQVHDSKLNSRSDDTGCSRSRRYATVTYVHKKFLMEFYTSFWKWKKETVIRISVCSSGASS